MKHLLLPVWLVSATLVGCAAGGGGSPVTTEEVAEAEAAMRSAEAAGAENYAPELFRESREAFQASRRASSRGEQEAARRLLLESQDYAAAAEARVRTERLRSDAQRLRREADELETRTRDIMEEAQRPPA